MNMVPPTNKSPIVGPNKNQQANQIIRPTMFFEEGFGNLRVKNIESLSVIHSKNIILGPKAIKNFDNGGVEFFSGYSRNFRKEVLLEPIFNISGLAHTRRQNALKMVIGRQSAVLI